jgi:predicted RNase H-like HicB family nuclease
MDFSDLRLKLTAVFEEAPEGGYTCSFEEFPDVFSEGGTLEEARANLLDALQLVLAYHRDEAHKLQSAHSPFLREALELTAA